MNSTANIGAELSKVRNAKGFTQRDLAEKCNLTVRTIQRIESGEVMPRAYTIKMISTILDFDFFSISKAQDGNENAVNNSYWNVSSALFWHLKDLFNLKTHAMKKLTILSIIFGSIGFGLLTFINDSEAQGSKDIDYSKFMLPSLQRGIRYYFPKGERIFVSNVKDTADYKVMGDLIQEYKNNIYLNGKFIGKAMKSDTVIYNFGELIIKSAYWKFTSSYGQNIHYLIPIGTPINDLIVNIDTEWLYIGKHVIMEYDYKIFLDRKYQGKVNYGDTVIYRNEMLELLK